MTGFFGFFSHTTKQLFLVVVALLLTGCSSSLIGGVPKEEALQKIKWGYGKKAIQLVINASDDLNTYNDEAHSLALVVVQYADPNKFMPYTRDSKEIVNLLIAGSKSKGWLSAQQIFVKPGQKNMILIDRAKTAQYLGIVAGYNDLSPEKSANSYELGIKYKSKGIFIQKYQALPAPLQIDLTLGGLGILDTKASDKILEKVVKEPKARVMPKPKKADKPIKKSNSE